MHAISSAEDRLQPASDAEMEAAILRVADMAIAFRIDCDPARVGKLYRDLLATVPADLLNAGIDLVLTETTDSFRVPLPGMILKAVMGEFQRRRAALDRLRTARMIGERRGWPAETAPGEYMPKKSLDDLMAGVRETLDDHTRAFHQHHRKRPTMTASAIVVKVQRSSDGYLVYNQQQTYFELPKELPADVLAAIGDEKKAYFSVEYEPGIPGLTWGARVEDPGW